MKDINKISKIFMYISFVSGIIWLGNYITRLTTTYYLFEGTEFQVKDYFTRHLSGSLSMLVPSISINLITFPLFVVFFLLFILTSKISLRKHGWLFISLILVLFTLPFEVIFYIIDIKIFNLLFYGGFDAQYALSLIIERLKILSSVPLIVIFNYLAVIFFVTFQPLNKKD